jgi:hypothetical protein
MSTILATLKHSKKSAHQIHLPLSPVFHFPLELLVDLLKKKKKKKITCLCWERVENTQP